MDMKLRGMDNLTTLPISLFLSVVNMQLLHFMYLSLS